MHTPPTSRPVSINRGGQEAGVHRGKDPSLVFMRARALLLRTLGDSAARQSATDIRPLFLSASSPLFSRPLFPFSLSLFFIRIRRGHGPTSRWPNARARPDAETWHACYVKPRTYLPFSLPSVLFLPFLITCRISVFLGNRSRELTWTVTNRTSSGGWNNLLLAKVIESVKKSFFLPMSRMNLSRLTWTVFN